jgi:cytochrome b6-f complex iron-sulfur subunit
MVSRREFMERVSAGVVGGALPWAAGACAKFQYLETGIEDRRLVVRLADFGAGPYALVDAPNLPMPVYLYRHPDGRFTAVLTRCMHQGCQVEPGRGRLVCPCHGSEYTNEGGVLKGPTLLPLIQFPVLEQDGNLYIALENLEAVRS